MFLPAVVFFFTAAPLLWFLFLAARGLRPLHIAAFALIAAALSLHLATRPHQDCLSGLDNAAYGSMADCISRGMPLRGKDALAEKIPRAGRDLFLYRPVSHSGTYVRPTRDRIFQLDLDDCSYRPFFFPALPLAEAGSRLGRYFVPSIGLLWALALLAAAMKRGGLRGCVVFSALFFLTPYPSWFFRGEFTEAVGAALATMPVLALFSCRPKGALFFAVSAFSLGFSLFFHLTMALIAIPAFAVLLISSPKSKNVLCAYGGFVLGFIPLALATRFISSPYGDWTRPEMLLGIIFSCTEHKVLFSMALLLAVLALAVPFFLRGKAALAAKKTETELRHVELVLPFILLVLLAAIFPECLPPLKLFLSSLKSHAMLLAVFGFALLAGRKASPLERIYLASVSLSLVAFFLIFSAEIKANGGNAVGVWSFRRFLPPVLAIISALPVALSGFYASNSCGKKGLALAALLLFSSLYGPLRHSQAYFAINGKGSDEAAEKLCSLLERSAAGLVFFDYHPHSIPAIARRPFETLAIGKHAKERWDDAARLISEFASESSLAIVSSYTPPLLEENFALRRLAKGCLAYETVKSKSFLDAKTERVSHPYTVSIAEKGAGAPAQSTLFDGSPLSLRGRWHFTRRGGAWSREGSGIIGPLPGDGRKARLTLDVSWPQPEGSSPAKMVLSVDGTDIRQPFAVPPGRHKIKLTAESPSGRYRGIYRFHSENPYDPAKDGLKGYPRDLGVYFHSAEIKLCD